MFILALHFLIKRRKKKLRSTKVERKNCLFTVLVMRFYLCDGVNSAQGSSRDMVSIFKPTTPTASGKVEEGRKFWTRREAWRRQDKRGLSVPYELPRRKVQESVRLSTLPNFANAITLHTHSDYLTRKSGLTGFSPENHHILPISRADLSADFSSTPRLTCNQNPVTVLE